MKFLGPTMIALGFMNDNKSLYEVMKATCDFIGRKLNKNEFDAIVRQYYKKKEEEWKAMK